MASWYNAPYGTVGRSFTTILAAEWRGVIGRTWNFERPLVFANVVLKKTLGVCRAKEIRDRITRRMDLWDRGLHVGLLVDAELWGIPGRAETPAEERRRMWR